MIYGASGLLPPLGALGDDDEAGNGQEILALNEKKKKRESSGDGQRHGNDDRAWQRC